MKSKRKKSERIILIELWLFCGSKKKYPKKKLAKSGNVLCNVITVVRKTIFVAVICLLSFIFYIRTIQLVQIERLQSNASQGNTKKIRAKIKKAISEKKVKVIVAMSAAGKPRWPHQAAA